MKQEEKEELTKTENKYGVIIKTYTTTTYNIFSDGSRTEGGTRTRTEYDTSNYRATTSELLPDARNLKSLNSSYINGVLSYTNQYRREANEKAIDGITDRKDLTLDSNLTVAACARAIEMAYGNKYSHTRPNGTMCYTILGEMGIGYSRAAENIHCGPTTAESASRGWKNSSGHYANMINSDFTKIGVGVIRFNGKCYWAQIFTK